MTRARSLSKLSNPATFTVDTDNNVGVNSVSPVEKLNIVGVVSATSFFGDGAGLTGVASTDNIITGTAATFNNVVKVGTAITLDATSGIITAVNGFVGNVTGNATGLSGTPDITVRNVTGVAATFTGVLTYDDVTNVDSLGIVTARSGVEFGASGVGGTITAAGQAEFAGIVTALGVNVSGIVTAASFQGSGADLTNLPASGDSNDITASLFL